MRARWASCGAILLLLGTSCAGDGTPPAGPPDAGQSRFARLHVEVSLPREGDPVIRTEARFLRVTDMDVETAQVLAGASELPADWLPMGRCVRSSADALVDDALASASPDAQVTMLDAGDLIVQAAGRPDRLTPRVMPEIVPFVTGLWYESEDAGAVNAPLYLDDDADVQISGYGGHDIGRFDTSVRLPAPPVITRVGSADVIDAPVIIDRNADLEVTWASAARGDDALVVSLSWGRGELLRCRAAQGTRFVVPRAQLVDALRGLDASVPLALSVERVRRVFWSAPGLDAADLIVSVRDVVPARLP